MGFLWGSSWYGGDGWWVSSDVFVGSVSEAGLLYLVSLGVMYRQSMGLFLGGSGAMSGGMG